MSKIIEVENLIFDYVKTAQQKSEDAEPEQKKVRAIDGITFDVGKGEFLAIVGRNGSGKSTLAKILNALLLPTEGTAMVKGFDTRDEEHLWDIRQTAGIVFQNPDNQLVSSIVEDDVAFGPENMGVAPSEIRSRVDNALKAVGMEKYARKAPHLLSGGQKQRVAIAGAVAMMPEVIIFDEPTAMLDPKGRGEIMGIIKDLHEKGITVILITHFMDEAAEADRVIVMDSGKIVGSGKPEKIFNDDRFLEEYRIDPPVAVKLAAKLRDRGLSIPESVITEEGILTFLTGSGQKNA